MNRNQEHALSLPHLSQSLFRALQSHIDPRALCPGGDPYDHVATTIDRATARLAADRQLFRRPQRALFQDIRWCFPLSRQPHVWSLVAAWVPKVDAHLDALKSGGLDAEGNPLRCPVFTRKGTPCARAPLPHNGHCPSHQHLVVEHELQPA